MSALNFELFLLEESTACSLGVLKGLSVEWKYLLYGFGGPILDSYSYACFTKISRFIYSLGSVSNFFGV